MFYNYLLYLSNVLTHYAEYHGLFNLVHEGYPAIKEITMYSYELSLFLLMGFITVYPDSANFVEWNLFYNVVMYVQDLYTLDYYFAYKASDPFSTWESHIANNHCGFPFKVRISYENDSSIFSETCNAYYIITDYRAHQFGNISDGPLNADRILRKSELVSGEYPINCLKAQYCLHFYYGFLNEAYPYHWFIYERLYDLDWYSIYQIKGLLVSDLCQAFLFKTRLGQYFGDENFHNYFVDYYCWKFPLFNFYEILNLLIYNLKEFVDIKYWSNLLGSNRFYYFPFEIPFVDYWKFYFDKSKLHFFSYLNIFELGNCNLKTFFNLGENLNTFFGSDNYYSQFFYTDRFKIYKVGDLEDSIDNLRRWYGLSDRIDECEILKRNVVCGSVSCYLNLEFIDWIDKWKEFFKMLEKEQYYFSDDLLKHFERCVGGEDLENALSEFIDYFCYKYYKFKVPYWKFDIYILLNFPDKNFLLLRQNFSLDFVSKSFSYIKNHFDSTSVENYNVSDLIMLFNKSVLLLNIVEKNIISTNNILEVNDYVENNSLEYKKINSQCNSVNESVVSQRENLYSNSNKFLDSNAVVSDSNEMSLNIPDDGCNNFDNISVNSYNRNSEEQNNIYFYEEGELPFLEETVVSSEGDLNSDLESESDNENVSLDIAEELYGSSSDEIENSSFQDENSCSQENDSESISQSQEETVEEITVQEQDESSSQVESQRDIQRSTTVNPDLSRQLDSQIDRVTSQIQELQSRTDVDDTQMWIEMERVVDSFR